MKLTLIISSLSGGGAERQACNLANFLAERGHDITILTVSGKHTYNISDKIRLVCMYNETESKLPKPIINIIRMLKFNKYLRKERPDTYITFLPKLTYLLYKQLKWIKCPVIVCERNDPEKYCKESGMDEEVFIKSHSIGKGYVFQTEQAKKYYKNYGIKIENSIVIPNAISSEFIRPHYRGEREKIIVAVGRLSPQKNFQLLINAFSKLGAEFKDYKLFIYGDGPLKNELLQLISELNLTDRVELKGFAQDIIPNLEKATLYVMSSDFEGMPNTLMEAMALGLPCISTNCPVGGPGYLIRTGVNGILVSVGDEDEMLKAIIMLLSDNNLREQIGQEASLISNDLNPERIYSLWEIFIEEIVSENNSN